MSRRLTINDFIEKAKRVHTHNYVYTKSVYTTSHNKIEILCPIHGTFWQIANDHLNGRGCPQCGKWTKTTTSDNFIERARRVHGNIYDYSKVEYKNSYQKVIIGCSIHGDFKQVPYSHWRGSGCQKCSSAQEGINRKKSIEEFIKQSQDVHGNLYDYSNVVYKKASIKVIIRCLKHGNFQQTPINHIANKHGCPQCNVSVGERVIKQWLEVHNITHEIQKTFPTCRNPLTNYPLRYDFFVPDKNLLIEYDGRQHFEVGNFGTHHRTKCDLEKTKFRDDIKTKFAEQNKITLIRIPFYIQNQINDILRGVFHG